MNGGGWAGYSYGWPLRVKIFHPRTVDIWLKKHIYPKLVLNSALINLEPILGISVFSTIYPLYVGERFSLEADSHSYTLGQMSA